MVVERIARKNDIQYFDITPISLKAKDDKTYVADDGLHPSGKMYKEWVELIKESVYLRLKSNITVFPNKNPLVIRTTCE